MIAILVIVGKVGFGKCLRQSNVVNVYVTCISGDGDVTVPGVAGLLGCCSAVDLHGVAARGGGCAAELFTSLVIFHGDGTHASGAGDSGHLRRTVVRLEGERKSILH